MGKAKHLEALTKVQEAEDALEENIRTLNQLWKLGATQEEYTDGINNLRKSLGEVVKNLSLVKFTVKDAFIRHIFHAWEPSAPGSFILQCQNCKTQRHKIEKKYRKDKKSEWINGFPPSCDL